MKTNEIRRAFLEYFEQHQHTLVSSSSLIPSQDPTLLFTNAGMVQFKDVFLGNEQRAYTRATSFQRCLRAGGKHNDLENVGYTSRHHTFFEMLGNFSFGDYFKKEAILFAWEFLTKQLKLSPERFWITVFHDDQESEQIWLNEIKINPKHFSRSGEKDNFWSMGETGPCGPCTEIFYDHGPELQGGPPGSSDEDGDRYVEIWNLVFVQFDRRANGVKIPLNQPYVDTGMGLERIAAVMQGVHDNYDIDLFKTMLKSLSLLVNCNDFSNQSMRVIVDHIRSSAFLVMDGVTPSNEGRGYVLRRIIRRAILHGYKLIKKHRFFHKLVPALVTVMGGAYPKLKQSKLLIQQILQQEQEKFANTLMKGMKRFEQVIKNLESNEIPGKAIFQLYDTYGFPSDLTADMAREKGLKLDSRGFQLAMEAQRKKSKQSRQPNSVYIEQFHFTRKSKFLGHHSLVAKANVTALLKKNQLVSKLKLGDQGAVILDRTPFYAESGGQVGDTGYLLFDQGRFRVLDTQKKGSSILHYGKLLKGKLSSGASVYAEVSEERFSVMLNHSATHLLHAALRQVLGSIVTQKGSLVDTHKLRFDFSYPHPLKIQEIHSIEYLVNQKIRANLRTFKDEIDLEAAKSRGAMAFFEEKYGDRVRVVQMGDFSIEICGGTHVSATGEIGLFKITSESSVAAGVRRIEGLTGESAFAWVIDSEERINGLCRLLRTNRSSVHEKVSSLLHQNHQMNKSIQNLKQEILKEKLDTLVDKKMLIKNVNVIATSLINVDRDILRYTLDQLRSKMTSYAVILASVNSKKVQFVAGVSKDCLKYFNATELLNTVASRVGGKGGGGRPDLAQGGGDNSDALLPALNSVSDWIKEKIYFL